VLSVCFAAQMQRCAVALCHRCRPLWEGGCVFNCAPSERHGGQCWPAVARPMLSKSYTVAYCRDKYTAQCKPVNHITQSGTVPWLCHLLRYSARKLGAAGLISTAVTEGAHPRDSGNCIYQGVVSGGRSGT